MLQHGFPGERQRQFGLSHAGAFAGGRDEREDHERTFPALTRTRTGTSVLPRLRQAISSATMLMAISGTVCEPMSKPSGACTLSNISELMPLAMRSSKMILIFRLLPIMPT